MDRKKNDQKMVFQETLSVVDDSPVFKFICPNANDKLSEMKGVDLQDLIILIDDYYIKLRDRLGFTSCVTFGLELEFECIMERKIKRRLKEAFLGNEWVIEPDDCQTEIDSPILRDTEFSWESLNKVCSIVEPLGSVGKNSGGHVHIGTQVLGAKKNSWLNFIKMWSVYENIIYRFSYGSFLTARPSLKEYAEPMAKVLWNDYVQLKRNRSSLEAIILQISHKRYQAINFGNVSINYCGSFENNNTIEFRCPNGSLDAAIWQNNVNLFVKMLLYSRSTSYNDDLIQQRHESISDKFTELKWYDEIYLDQALELCDMIFTNNFDKVYFLRQYLKSFEVCKRAEKYSKAPVLTKKK